MSDMKQTSQTPCCGPSPDESNSGAGCCAPGPKGGFKLWYMGIIVLAIGVAIAALVS